MAACIVGVDLFLLLATSALFLLRKGEKRSLRLKLPSRADTRDVAKTPPSRVVCSYYWVFD